MNLYNVIDRNGSILFQGCKEEAEKYAKLFRHKKYTVVEATKEIQA